MYTTPHTSQYLYPVPKNIDRKIEDAASFFFKGNVPRAGDFVSREEHYFKVDHVSWEMGIEGSVITTWARLHLTSDTP